MASFQPFLPLWEKGVSRFTVLLGEPRFYFELLLSVLSITFAVLVAILVKKQVARRMSANPSSVGRIFLYFMPLTAPLLGIAYLSVAQPIAAQYSPSGAVIEASMRLCVAWLFAKMVWITVHARLVAWLMIAAIFVTAILSVTGFMEPTAQYLDSLDIGFGKYQISVLGVLQGIFVLVVVFWLASTLSRQLEHSLRGNTHISYNARELIVKLARVLLYAAAFFITLDAVGIDLTAFAIFGGALGVGAGLGLQKITANFVSGIILLLEKSIKIGDLVEVGTYTGWVRNLNMRYALIETAEGREVLVPNDELINTRITNWTYSSESVRMEIRIVVTYDSDIENARQQVLEAARSHPRCARDPAPSCFLREFTETGAALLLTYWIENVRDGRMNTQSEVMLEIMRRFKAEGIGFSHDPTRRKQGD